MYVEFLFFFYFLLFIFYLYFLFFFRFLVMLFVCSILLHGFFAVYEWVFFLFFIKEGCGTVGSDPTLSLSRVGLAPPLSFSLYLSCACGPCAPLLTWALLPHPCFAQAGAASLSPGRSLARDTPRMPQKPLVSVSVSLEFLSLYICVMGVNCIFNIGCASMVCGLCVFAYCQYSGHSSLFSKKKKKKNK